MILTPFIYATMILIAGIFSISNARMSNCTLSIGKTILTGFCVYIFQNILFEFGSSGILNIYLSTVLVSVLMFLVSVIFLIKKIELCNLKNIL